jgi:hypothetical protein
MKTPEEMAEEYANDLAEDFNRLFPDDAAQPFIETFLAGYKAAQNQLADADKVMPDICEHILDMEKMVDVNGWISVHDRLPDEEIDVLVCCEITINGNLIKHQQVIRFIGGNWDTSLPNSITYWQVLPKLPGE